ncbi:hypothetical protein DMC47_09815 [Nostoc sp. 3335mG]|nr:hypothetical protein DMC47_09815 [Nostoc sp. 3335mG]
MRSVIPFLALLPLAVVQTVQAQSPFWSAAESGELDTLFARLADASDEAEARSTADAIWIIWTRPDNEEAAARVAEIIEKAGFGGPATQLPLIEGLVADFPDYPEAWNMRATARFLRGDNDGALADIAETLKREPRHFGALAGRALILDSQGKGEPALSAMRAALAVHPFLPERQLFPELAGNSL